MLRVLSLGAGVQSSTLALMYARGDLAPAPDCAIFADTDAEPQSVYEWLDWLETKLPFPVHRVMKKDGLHAALMRSLEGGRFASVPFYTESGTRRGIGMLRRQCTREFKVEPITKKLRELIGLKFRQRAPKTTAIIQAIGISLDEAHRMKPSRERWIEHIWPLIDAGMTRSDCLTWMARHGYPRPPKSACSFCPYHDDAQWLDLKHNQPEAWEQAVTVDRLIRNGVRGTRQRLFLHESLRPLDEVEFSPVVEEGRSFGNECEGMCGV
jgi:hypothetical protein